MATILPISTLVPDHCVDATEVKRCLELVLGSSGAESYRKIVDATRVDRRWMVAPVTELLALKSIQEKNDLYIGHALAMGEQVARDALALAEIASQSLDAIITVSCTGYTLPSLDAHLVAKLLARESQGAVLVVSVELSSTGVQATEPSTAEMIANLLFGDAAAATVVTTGSCQDGPEIIGAQSVLWPEGLDDLGVRLTDSGFRIVLSPRLPGLIRDRVREAVTDFLARYGVTIEDVKFWALHPGGPKILKAVAEGLALSDAAVQSTWETWRQYGNVSSSTVFFVLRQIQQCARPACGDFGMLLAFGPGLTCEMALLSSAGWLSGR